MAIPIHFLPDDVTIEAEPGEALLRVALRAGVVIPTGCCMGSCHACEVEMNGEAVCSCITSVPKNVEAVTIDLYTDPNW
jgi:ferredoxin